MAETLNLKDAAEPRISLELPDGTKRELDPWELAEKIEGGIRQAVKEEDATLSRTFDVIRKAAGFPTSAEVEAAPEPKPYTPSRNGCMRLQTIVNKFVGEFEITKK